MNIVLRRALARQSKALALAVATFGAAADDAAAPLALADAAALALAAQPLLDAQRHAVDGAREAATAAAQLPDPVLVGAVDDFAVEGAHRYAFDAGDTRYMLGVKQAFPGGAERALRGTRGNAEAGRLAAHLAEQRRTVRREAALAWLDAWRAVRAQELLAATLAEAQRHRQAVDIAYRAGRAAQADLLAAGVAVELLHDQLAGMAQTEWHARNRLRRWIGADAERPIAGALPAWNAPDEMALLARLEAHPHVATQQAAVMVAHADVELARADRMPDWSVKLGYGYRPEHDDYAALELEVGLPLFTGRRQDRIVAGRSAELRRAESLREDALRQHRAEVRLNVADWQRLQERLRRYDESILPPSQQRLDAALAAYGAGNGTLIAVLDARRSLLDVRMQRLELELDAARHRVQLEYFAIDGDAP